MSCLMNLYLKVLYVAVRKWSNFPKIDVGIMLYMFKFKDINWKQIRMFFFLYCIVGKL